MTRAPTTDTNLAFVATLARRMWDVLLEKGPTSTRLQTFVWSRLDATKLVKIAAQWPFEATRDEIKAANALFIAQFQMAMGEHRSFPIYLPEWLKPPRK